MCGVQALRYARWKVAPLGLDAVYRVGWTLNGWRIGNTHTQA
jgi:hypothetical protein